MPVPPSAEPSPHEPWKPTRTTPPDIALIPDAPHINELLTHAHQVTERLEGERATVYLTELLAHSALPLDAMRELRLDLLMLETHLSAHTDNIQTADPDLLDLRTAQTRLDRACIHHAGRALDRSLANTGFTHVTAHA